MRKQALELLIKYPRHERLSDSMAYATVTTWLLNEEEKRLIGDSLPEAARLRLVTRDRKLTERKVIPYS